ncbi:MAG: single-stranded DNA-binding protein [Patescibacteria group bacterium]
MYLNKAIIIGNLTRDPELKALPSGIQVTSLALATNRVWKDQNGAKQEAVDYHNVVVFGRQAETAAQYLKKGSSVLVEGRMQTRSWDGQDGKKQYRTEVVADRVQFGDRPSGASAGGSSFGTSAPAGAKKSVGEDEGAEKKGGKNALEQLDSISYPEEEINPEDIPF